MRVQNHRWIFLALVFFLGIRSPLWGAPPVLIFDLDAVGTSSGVVTRIYGSSGNNGSSGVPVAGGFDCDGDGFIDSAFAGIKSSPLGRTRAGEVSLVLGDGTLGGTIDTEEFPSNSRILKIAGDQNHEIAGAEIWMDDVTGDGLGDLLICRQNYTPAAGREGAGALSILVGYPGLRDLAASTDYLDLRTPPTNALIKTFYGASNRDRLGIWVRTGDVTGDTIADIVVGADRVDASGEVDRGAIYVIRGGAHLANTQAVDLADFGTNTFTLTGHVMRIDPPAGSGNYHMGATCQIADLDGNGRSEVLAAATLNRAGAALGYNGEYSPASGGAPDGTLYIAWDDNFPTGLWANGYAFDIFSSPGAHTIINGENSQGNASFGKEIIARIVHTF